MYALANFTPPFTQQTTRAPVTGSICPNIWLVVTALGFIRHTTVF